MGRVQTFGRGSFISERNHRVSEMVQAGVPPHEASVRADQETAEVKEVRALRPCVW